VGVRRCLAVCLWVTPGKSEMVGARVRCEQSKGLFETSAYLVVKISMIFSCCFQCPVPTCVCQIAVFVGRGEHYAISCLEDLTRMVIKFRAKPQRADQDIIAIMGKQGFCRRGLHFSHISITHGSRIQRCPRSRHRYIILSILRITSVTEQPYRCEWGNRTRNYTTVSGYLFSV
jgi:hypothetical protein